VLGWSPRIAAAPSFPSREGFRGGGVLCSQLHGGLIIGPFNPSRKDSETILFTTLSPFVLIQDADQGDTGSLVEIGRDHFCELSEAADLDPVWVLLFGG